MPILYGLLAPSSEKVVRGGLAVEGGCVLGRENPDWHCKGCGNEWFDADDPVRKAKWDALDRETEELRARCEAKEQARDQAGRTTGAPGGARR